MLIGGKKVLDIHLLYFVSAIGIELAWHARSELDVGSFLAVNLNVAPADVERSHFFQRERRRGRAPAKRAAERGHPKCA